MVILGAGESGAGAAVLAKKLGYDVFVSDFGTIKDSYRQMLDAHGIEWEEKQHSMDRILSATEVVKSPGIPDKAPVIQALKEHNIPIISEIEFAGRHTDSHMICITGSNGKTTTTMLTYHILQQGGLDVGLAGNVGKSLALQVAEDPHSYYVIELSSFQLDYMFDFKADVAVLLNITPDHLDRYHYNMQEYVDAKFRIVQNQTVNDAFVYWNDDPIIKRELEKRGDEIKATRFPFSLQRGKGIKAFLEKNVLVVETPDQSFEMAASELSLRGTHNLYNTMASALSANLTHIKKSAIRQALSDFRGVEHRLELAGNVGGVTYINDSKATNVNSCWYALESMKTPLVLILGGTDKGNDYSEIEALVREKVHSLVFLGVDNAKLHAFFDGKVAEITDALSMEEAVHKAQAMAREGDTVLLSPCCASFDLFKNYEDRGDQFKAVVSTL